MPLQAEARQKARAVQVLFAIVILFVLTNSLARQDYEVLNKNIASIYQDRLMPSAYLFKITDHLYQKQIGLQTDEKEAAWQQHATAHNEAINKLVQDYEATYLTKDEKQHWSAFKKEWTRYTELENKLLAAGATTNNNPLLQNSFNSAIHTLNLLNDLQTTEGKRLQQRSHAIIGGSLIQSYLEIALLFIMCIVILKLMGISEKLNPAKQRPILN